mmetsp:Transcript_47034/g.130683  ORF Transcript_47034/g.130683 Transcript_47034/m.130683 type:complete len:257 (-) Transcript_47034:98-868(-)|eukprot:6666026-Prymnesium_polylepis.1
MRVAEGIDTADKEDASAQPQHLAVGATAPAAAFTTTAVTSAAASRVHRRPRRRRRPVATQAALWRWRVTRHARFDRLQLLHHGAALLARCGTQHAHDLIDCVVRLLGLAPRVGLRLPPRCVRLRHAYAAQPRLDDPPGSHLPVARAQVGRLAEAVAQHHHTLVAAQDALALGHPCRSAESDPLVAPLHVAEARLSVHFTTLLEAENPLIRGAEAVQDRALCRPCAVEGKSQRRWRLAKQLLDVPFGRLRRRTAVPR